MSFTPFTVTVCGWSQSPVVKVSVFAERFTSSGASLVRLTTTFPVGRFGSTTVKVASAPSFASVAAPLNSLAYNWYSRMVSATGSIS